MHGPLEAWCYEELNKLLGSSPPEEIVKYVLEIQAKEELEGFLVDLFGHLIADVREKFMTDLLSLKKKVQSDQFGEQQNTLAGIQEEQQPTAYRKPELEDVASSGQVLSGNGSNRNKHKGKKNKAQHETVTNDKSHILLDPLLAPNNNNNNETSTKSPNSSSGGKRHSGKFVPLYDTSQVVLLPGRHPCLCQATEHSLINNCIKCGRIVCQQEGSGPCFTCGDLVCTPEEKDIIRRGSRKSEKLVNQLSSTEDQDLLRKATEHKNRLLEFSITSAQRTQVIDDESDYFSLSENKWLSEDERKAMRKKAQEEHSAKHASRFGKKFTLSLDLDGRKVTMDDGFGKSKDKVQSVASEISRLQLSSEKVPSRPPVLQHVENSDVHPMMNVLPPVYEPGDSSSSAVNHRTNVSLPAANLTTFRLQDRDLQELSDQGFCLSMHQPWASLLVRGIKIHEGRTWYTAYRGPLWIHSGSKPSTEQEIMETENTYRLIHENKNLEFPKRYPVSALLGCVNLVDCLQQEDYRKQYPSGESASPYVFICENPQELTVKIPMSGKPKIFKMDATLHKTVKKTLRKFNENKFI